jgi:DNA-binding transcriptional ArsR family regulator
MFRNVKMSAIISPLSGLLLTISAPARLEILLIVGAGEACVCYLESRLGYRQAYISQHLMALRQAGLIDSRREGKYVFYRLIKPKIMPLIRQAAEISGVSLPVIQPVSPLVQRAYSYEPLVTAITFDGENT